jgi:hypothetical protein
MIIVHTWGGCGLTDLLLVPNGYAKTHPLKKLRDITKIFTSDIRTVYTYGVATSLLLSLITYKVRNNTCARKIQNSEPR